ncbi:hypothetical protein HHI36_024089, partial [Cryptolaemus montrouzieri]
MFKEFKIEKITIPLYSPQNNPIERPNKVIKTMIAQLCGNNHKKWDSYLPELIHAMNTSNHDST